MKFIPHARLTKLQSRLKSVKSSQNLTNNEMSIEQGRNFNVKIRSSSFLKLHSQSPEARGPSRVKRHLRTLTFETLGGKEKPFNLSPLYAAFFPSLFHSFPSAPAELNVIFLLLSEISKFPGNFQ